MVRIYCYVSHVSRGFLNRADAVCAGGTWELLTLAKPRNSFVFSLCRSGLCVSGEYWPRLGRGTGSIGTTW